MKRKIKHLWYEITKRGFIVVVFLLGFSAILIWFLVTGISPSETTIIIGISAIAAVFAAISSVATLMQATEAQKQRENQERPYITAFFEGTGRGMVYLEIQNGGNSPALNVTFDFDPQPVDFAGRKLSEVSLFQKPISFMPQGKIYRQAIEMGFRFLAEGKPTKYRVKITYSSISGELFTPSVDYDLEYLKQATLPGKTIDENLEDISKHLKDIKDIFQGVHKDNSILVQTPKEYENRFRARMDERKELPKWKQAIRSFLENALEKINR